MGIFVIDDLHPEDSAMLQALYSRSPASVATHLDKLREQGSGKFMDSYYVGYGHASIGDCGSTSIFIENVSMLAAKAIQDNPLYNGQEVSTRYVDYSTQSFVAPYQRSLPFIEEGPTPSTVFPLYKGTAEFADPYHEQVTSKILERWRALYVTTLPKLVAALGARYPFNPQTSKSEKIWDNAIKARAFDILRGYLPVGASTSLAWHTNLRQLRDNLRRLYNHPLPEVRQVAQDIYAAVIAKYPHSFNGTELSGDARYQDRDTYQKGVDQHYFDGRKSLTPAQIGRIMAGEVLVDDSCFNTSLCNTRHGHALASRPAGAALPRQTMECGVYTYTFALDFGSYRDLQRHRNAYCPIPLVTADHGLHPWYQDQITDLLPQDAPAILAECDDIISIVKTLPDPYLNQYYLPMGLAQICQLTCALPEVLYVGELRSSQAVHATLRVVAQQMLRSVQDRHPMAKIYGDFAPDKWSEKRGEQTITKKAS